MSCNSSLFFTHDDSTVLLLRKISKIAAKVAFYNFEWRYVTLVMFNNIKLIGLASFLSHYKQSVLLKMGKFIPRQRAVILQFVIFAEETSELTDMLRWIARNKYDISGKFIIICSSIDDEKCNEQQIFDKVASVNIVNVLFIKGYKGKEDPSVFSYFPILPEKCMNSEPVKMNISLNCTDDTCFKTAYPEKFSNMHQCPFIVSTIEQPPFMEISNSGKTPMGADGEILSLVVKILNASLIMKTPVEGIDWGHYENNNWTGSLGDVFNNRAHASMCSAPLNPAKYGNFQISFTYTSMDIVWAAALPALKPPWEKLLYPLHMYVRIIIFFMFIGIIFMNTFTKSRAWGKVIRALKINPPRSNLFFYSWIIFLGMPILKAPSKSSLLMTVGMWIWFSFIIRTVYQAALITILKQRIYDEPLSKFDEVLSNNNPFGGLPTVRDYYWEDKSIYDNWQVMGLVEAFDTLDRISSGNSNFVLALNKETILYKLIKSNGSKHLQIIPQKIVNSPTVIFFKKYSFIADPISRILSIALEGGFGQKSYSQFLRKGQSLLRHSKKGRTEPLRLEHFVGSFAILIAGMLLSIVFFAVEVICGRLINVSRDTSNI